MRSMGLYLMTAAIFIFFVNADKIFNKYGKVILSFMKILITHYNPIAIITLNFFQLKKSQLLYVFL